jgi:putative membrane protein
VGRLKRLTYLTGLAGLLLLIGLVVHAGLPDILRAFARAGWPLLLLVPAHLIPLALDAQGWRVLLRPIDPERRATLPFLLWIASVREAIGRLLPAASIGGEVVGIRLSRLRLQDTTAVAATVIIEVLITVVVQYLFCGLGLVLIIHSAAGAAQLWTYFVGLLLSFPIPIVMFVALRHGALFARVEAIAKRLLGMENRLAMRLDGVRLDSEVRNLFNQPGRLARTLAWQLAGYVIGSAETWFALQLLGHPVDIGTAIAVEALTQVVRHATFFVPGGLGLHEAGVMLLASLAGITSDVGLSLALIKRMREVLFGIPALLSWQWVEASQLRPSRVVTPPKESATPKENIISDY